MAKQINIIKYCDRITKGGKELAVIWSGGGGEGDGEILIDGNPVERTPIAQLLIDAVGNHFDYGYFDGNFSSDAKVVYNSNTKSLQGTEEYSESCSDIRKCAIELLLPNELWFDSIEIGIDTDQSSVLSCKVQFHMDNGPITEEHAMLEDKLAKNLLHEIQVEMKSVEHLQGIWRKFNTNYEELKVKGQYRVFTINEFEYFYTLKEHKHVLISLTDSAQEDKI